MIKRKLELFSGLHEVVVDLLYTTKRRPRSSLSPKGFGSPRMTTFWRSSWLGMVVVSETSGELLLVVLVTSRDVEGEFHHDASAEYFQIWRGVDILIISDQCRESFQI